MHVIRLLNMDQMEMQDGSSGYIVLETNYRICAYTTSTLQIAILNLFTDIKFRFGNMVCGMLSQESTREAFDSGITADQIISYLTSHAHPEMQKHAISNKLMTPLPASVRDQIRLWYLDRQRLSFEAGKCRK
jgi:transcription initiation factor TFIIH subunit 4